MARRDPDDISSLLRDVEDSLGGAKTGRTGAGKAPARRGSAPANRRGGGGRLGSAVTTATVSGGVAAAAVFVLFALTPFLGAISGAAGAFLGAYLAVLITRLLHR